MGFFSTNQPRRRKRIAFLRRVLHPDRGRQIAVRMEYDENFVWRMKDEFYAHYLRHFDRDLKLWFYDPCVLDDLLVLLDEHAFEPQWSETLVASWAGWKDEDRSDQ